MKEFLWQVCCLIWHFDERVIREYEEREGNALRRYKEEQYQNLKEKEERYWNLYKEKHEKCLEVEESVGQLIDDKDFDFYEYGSKQSEAINYQCFWNNIYDDLFELGYELGDKTKELNILRLNR